MRIPRSVIVMSLVTAVPFGLAVRATLHERTRAAEMDEELAALEHQRELERQAFDEAERASTAAAEKARIERAHVIETMVGAQPAMPGELFAGLELGAVLDPAPLSRFEANGTLQPRHELDAKGRLSAFSIAVGNPFPGDCDTLRERLDATWGHSRDAVWIDPALHRRASVSGSDCRLRFDTYLPLADWLAAIPYDLVGKPKTAYDKLLGIFANADQITPPPYVMPGLDGGTDSTAIEPVIDGDRIIGLSISTTASDEVLAALPDALTARLHSKPTHDPDTDVYLWSRKPPVTLVLIGEKTLRLTVGEASAE